MRCFLNRNIYGFFENVNNFFFSHGNNTRIFLSMQINKDITLKDEYGHYFFFFFFNEKVQ